MYAANCNDAIVSCCSEIPVDGENEPSGSDCSECNPLACHCCVLFISSVQYSDIDTVVGRPQKDSRYLEFLPSPVTFQIWQPPKIS
tara:strand:- start:884 stop:1141 length:258 start_codon:yes stop_codon:yes gene_type:complete